ncbi:MAG: head-tail adaptor protein, partial [Armatimonadota bacterium]
MRASDGAGGFTETWTPVATAACRLSPLGQTPQEQVIAARLTNISGWVVTLPALTDVRPTDRLVIGSRTFEVVGILTGSWEISRRVICT